MIRKSIIAGVVLVVVSFSTSFAIPQLPPTNAPWLISFQGKLEGMQSQTANLTFNLWKRYPEGWGQTPWSEQHNDVDISDNGIFNVLLGESTPLPPLFVDPEATIWLEVVVDGTPLEPRQPLAAAPYAFVAKHLRGGIVDARSDDENKHAVRGQHTSTTWGHGVQGIAVATGNVAGVYGENHNAYGVYGNSSAAAGAGVHGYCSQGPGVEGISSSGHGVFGKVTFQGGYGVYGKNESPTTGSYGVYGDSNLGDGVGGKAYVAGKSGVYANNDAAGGYGLYGYSENGTGVFAESLNGSALVASSPATAPDAPTVSVANDGDGIALQIEKGKIRVPVRDETAINFPAGGVSGVKNFTISNTNITSYTRVNNEYITEDSQIIFVVRPSSSGTYPPVTFIRGVGNGYFDLGWGPTTEPANMTGGFRVYYLVIN